MLDPLLLEVLVDPMDRGPLYYFDSASVLFNPRTQCVYEVRDGIPTLLPDRARKLSIGEFQEFNDKLHEAVITGSSG